MKPNKPREIIGPLYFTRNAEPGKMPVVSAQLPQLFRAAQAERAQIDKEARTVPVIFASEAPCPRWFGRERLICTAQAMRLQRINTLGPFLSEHQRDRQIGVIVKDSPVATLDRLARAVLRFSQNPLAEQEWQDVNAEIRGLFSVGYVVHRLVLREESEEEGDLWDAVDWEPLEISLVSVPADINCSVDGERSTVINFPVTVTAETQQTAKLFDMKRRNFYFSRFMAPDTGGASGGTGTQTTPPATGGEGQRASGPDMEERTRCRELSAIGLKFNCMGEMAKFIEDGKPVSEAYKWVAENQASLRNGKQNPAPGQSPLNTGGGSVAPGSSFAPVSRSIGQMIVNAPAFKKLQREAGEDRLRAASFDLAELSSFSQRATLVSTEVPTQYVATDRLPGVQLLDQERLTIADLLAQGATSGQLITYLQEETYVNAAAAVAEGALKPEATFLLIDASAPVRKVAVTAKVTDEMLADYPYIQSFIDGRLRFMVAEREEALLLNGDGIAPNILGLLNTVGIQTHAKAGDTIADAIHKAITKARVIGKAEPSGVVMHPYDWERVALAKDANGMYLAGGPFFMPFGSNGFIEVKFIWGLPVVVTTAITEGTGLLGAFKAQAQLFRRQGITVETTISNEDDFKKNLVAFRAEERIALCVYRPAAFVKVTGLNA